jgi:polyisoprenoid-binding protein YceI
MCKLNVIVAVGLLTGLLFRVEVAGASSYKLDSAHTEIGFGVTHMMISKVKGRFTKFEGGFSFDEKSSDLKAVEVKIEAASITTDNQKRDEHLASDDFFAVKKFPMLTFKSEKVEMKKGKPAKVFGTLTMRGVSKPVVLDVEYRGWVVDPQGTERIGFSGSTKINRTDFGVSFNKTLDKGGVVVGNEVAIVIEGEATKDQPVKK